MLHLLMKRLLHSLIVLLLYYSVDKGFDEHDIPYDVLWLDIEHTDGKKYMTWDKLKFPTPDQMQKNLATKGRKVRFCSKCFCLDTYLSIPSPTPSNSRQINKLCGTHPTHICGVHSLV